MRRWFGVTVLGVVAAVVGFLGFTAIHNQGPGLAGPVVVLEFLLLVAEVGGLIAVVVGLIGVGVAAVRPGKGRRVSP